MKETRQRSPFDMCLKQAWELVEGPFYPFIDRLDPPTIENIVEQVSLEYHEYSTGCIPVSDKEGRQWAMKARAFIKQWQRYLKKYGTYKAQKKA